VVEFSFRAAQRMRESAHTQDRKIAKRAERKRRSELEEALVPAAEARRITRCPNAAIFVERKGGCFLVLS
jgi:hypothetical protein